jgi:multicomponent Na+:H+ antiporter subunit F
MSGWMIATLALLPALAIPVFMATRGTTASRVIAVQLATIVTIFSLELMTFVFDQSAFVDLPLALALLALPGTLLLALFLERWL